MITAEAAVFCVNIYGKKAHTPHVVKTGEFVEMSSYLTEQGFVLEELPITGAYFYTHSDGRFARIFLA